MIIVTTKTSTHFLNEKEFQAIIYYKDIRQVIVVSHVDDEHYQMCKDISEVEGVTYTTDAQLIQLNIAGSEVERLLKSCNEKADRIDQLNRQLNTIEDDLRKFAHEMITVVQHYHENMPDNVCKRMRERGEELKGKVNHGDYRKIQ